MAAQSVEEASASASVHSSSLRVRAVSRSPSSSAKYALRRLLKALRAADSRFHRAASTARSARGAAFRRFTVREGQALEDWATWCALAEIHGPDWRDWPAGLRAPRSAAVAAERERLRATTGFHAWVQWVAQEQRAAAQEAARAAGMSIGVISDLAVGAHPGGADAWAYPELLVAGVNVGAPPDGFIVLC